MEPFTPQKSNIDTKNCNSLRVPLPAFQGPSFWDPPAVSFQGCRLPILGNQTIQFYGNFDGFPL